MFTAVQTGIIASTLRKMRAEAQRWDGCDGGVDLAIEALCEEFATWNAGFNAAEFKIRAAYGEYVDNDGNPVRPG